MTRTVPSSAVDGLAAVAAVAAGSWWYSARGWSTGHRGRAHDLLLLAVAGIGAVQLLTRRKLEGQLRERAERVEREEALQIGQVRLSERTRIAREMHDVLAHRISLIAMQAGALEVDPDGEAVGVELAASLIRMTARQAQEELREVLGVLRAEAPLWDSLRPQPTLADLDRLIVADTEAGARVHLDDELSPVDDVPLLLGLTGYRIVQEGLTNARKHAPGAPSTVRLSGTPGGILVVEVCNGPPACRVRPDGSPPGFGLVVLRERVALAGGSLDHGPLPDDGFRVLARLPWREEVTERP